MKRRLPLAGRVITADEYTEGLRQRAEEEREKVEQKRVRREEMERKREEKREKMVEMERRREEKRIEKERKERAKALRQERANPPPAVDVGGHCALCRGVVPPGEDDGGIQEDQWVQCELCTLWFHWACVGLEEEPEGDWLCHKCT